MPARSNQQLDLQRKHQIQFMMLLGVALIMMIFMPHAMAGSDTTFDQIASTVSNWLEGSGGKLLTLLGLAIGLTGGLVKGSLGGLAFGLGLALSAYYGPNVLTAMFSATF